MAVAGKLPAYSAPALSIRFSAARQAARVKASARAAGSGIGVSPRLSISAHSWRAAISGDVRGAKTMAFMWRSPG